MSTYLEPKDHFVSINGLNIHYVDWGGASERVLLLAHGQGGTAHNWDHIARGLHDQFRVIALDQRGHGDSDHTREGYAVKDFASDLAEFAEAIDIIPYDFCGASLGARNGIPYAGDHSDHLKHFICLDYGPEMSPTSAKNQIGGMNRRPLGWRSIDEYVEHGMQLNPRAKEDHLRNAGKHGLRLNYADKYVSKQDPELFWINGSFGAKEVPYLWEQWSKITCPVLEMKGAESNFLSPEILSQMRGSQPNMHFLEVPESGHGISGDNPEFLIQELKNFLVD